MEIRPIDANALQELCNRGIQNMWNTGVAPVSWAAAYADFKNDIDSIPTLTPPPITGDTSDGYHTFNELYHHRAVLFSVVCNERPDIAWKSKRHHDGTMYNGMFIVGINTPEGQATYHYDIDPYWELFHVKELEYAPEWDGHTPDEAIRRIGTLTPPNDPLTIEELREMDGEPVYIVFLPDIDGEKLQFWVLVAVDEWGEIYLMNNLGGSSTYEEAWANIEAIYRRPPGEKE